MQRKQVIVYLEKSLKYLLSATLFLSFLTFMFVFAINWEDWFFGIKIEGLSAGVSLFKHGSLAIILVFLLARYPGKSRWITGAAILYFGIIFVNSSLTIQMMSSGREMYSPVLAAFFIIPSTSLNLPP